MVLYVNYLSFSGISTIDSVSFFKVSSFICFLASATKGDKILLQLKTNGFSIICCKIIFLHELELEIERKCTIQKNDGDGNGTLSYQRDNLVIRYTCLGYRFACFLKILP